MTAAFTSLLWLTGALTFLVQDGPTQQEANGPAVPQQEIQVDASGKGDPKSEQLTWPELLGRDISKEHLDRLSKEPLVLIDGLNKSRGSWLFGGSMKSNDQDVDFVASLQVEGGFMTHFEEVGRPGPGWHLSIQWPREKPEQTWDVALLPIMKEYDLQWRGYAKYSRVGEETNATSRHFFDGQWDSPSRTLTLTPLVVRRPESGASIEPAEKADADSQFKITVKENGELEINGFKPAGTISLSGKTAARIGDPYVEPDLNRLTLPNGYKVFFASRLQVILLDNEGSSVAGAKLEKIGCHEDIIYGLITQREGVEEPEDTLGYFWMDSATGEITKGMELGAWSKKLRDMGVTNPQMLNPEQVGPKF